MTSLVHLLREALGNPTAEFRAGQEEAIRAAGRLKSIVGQQVGYHLLHFSVGATRQEGN